MAARVGGCLGSWLSAPCTALLPQPADGGSLWPGCATISSARCWPACPPAHLLSCSSALPRLPSHTCRWNSPKSSLTNIYAGSKAGEDAKPRRGGGLGGLLGSLAMAPGYYQRLASTAGAAGDHAD